MDSRLYFAVALIISSILAQHIFASAPFVSFACAVGAMALILFTVFAKDKDKIANKA